MDLTCLDPSPEMLATAQPRVDAARAARGEGPAAYVQAIAENIPLPDNTFDMVFCLFSFRDFQDKARGCERFTAAQTGRAPCDLRRWEGQQTARLFRLPVDEQRGRSWHGSSPKKKSSMERFAAS